MAAWSEGHCDVTKGTDTSRTLASTTPVLNVTECHCMFCPMTVKSTHLIQGSVQVLHPPSKHAEGPAKYPIVGGGQKLSILFYFILLVAVNRWLNVMCVLPHTSTGSLGGDSIRHLLPSLGRCSYNLTGIGSGEVGMGWGGGGLEFYGVQSALSQLGPQ